MRKIQSDFRECFSKMFILEEDSQRNKKIHAIKTNSQEISSNLSHESFRSP